MKNVFCALLLCFLFLGQLGFRGLTEPDEGRTASMAVHMVRHGDWLVPHLYDQAHFNKPPMTYWMGAGCMRIGGINEAASRLPSALCALGILFLTGLLAKKLGMDPFWLPVLMLASSPLFFAMSQIADPNMPLSFFIMLAITAAFFFDQSKRRAFAWLFHSALGLACLTKGPAIPALVLASVITQGLLDKQSRLLALFRHPGAMLTGLIVGAAWYIAIMLRHPELVDFFIRGELWNRIFTEAHNRNETVFFYFLIIPLTILPWIIYCTRSFMGLKTSNPAHRAFFISWVVIPVIALTCAKSKLVTYHLPFLPLLILFIARSMPNFSKAAKVTAIASLLIYQGVLLGLLMNENKLGPHTTMRGFALAIKPDLKPADRVVLLGRHTKGLGFYLDHPISIPQFRFPSQIAADDTRLKDRYYNTGSEVDAWARTQRVYLLTTSRQMDEIEERTGTRPQELFRDSRTIAALYRHQVKEKRDDAKRHPAEK